MKITQHTPGPWIISKHGNIQDYYGHTIQVKGLVLTILTSGNKEAEANAELIVKAPEMFALLQHIRELCIIKGSDVAKQIDEILER